MTLFMRDCRLCKDSGMTIDPYTNALVLCHCPAGALLAAGDITYRYDLTDEDNDQKDES